MNWAAAAVVAAVVFGAIGIYFSARSASSAQNAARDARDQRKYGEGRASRDDEVALLRSQRDDARRERDIANTRIERLEGRGL